MSFACPLKREGNIPVYPSLACTQKFPEETHARWVSCGSVPNAKIRAGYFGVHFFWYKHTGPDRPTRWACPSHRPHCAVSMDPFTASAGPPPSPGSTPTRPHSIAISEETRISGRSYAQLLCTAELHGSGPLGVARCASRVGWSSPRVKRRVISPGLRFSARIHFSAVEACRWMWFRRMGGTTDGFADMEASATPGKGVCRRSFATGVVFCSVVGHLINI